MRADRSLSTIKRNNMELGKHVQLTLVSFEQQMLPTCRRLLFPCARGSRAIKEIGDANAIVCLSCFLLFVCLFTFWYRFRLFSPYLSNREHAAAKENMILDYASENRKIRYTSLKENEGQIDLSETGQDHDMLPVRRSTFTVYSTMASSYRYHTYPTFRDRFFRNNNK